MGLSVYQGFAESDQSYPGPATRPPHPCHQTLPIPVHGSRHLLHETFDTPVRSEHQPAPLSANHHGHLDSECSCSRSDGCGGVVRRRKQQAEFPVRTCLGNLYI